MKAFRYVILVLLTMSLVYWSVTIVENQNERWALANGNVGIYYWLIVPFVWLKVSAFLGYGIFHQLRQIKSNGTDLGYSFHAFTLFSISKRLAAAFIDFLFVGLIWLAGISFFAFVLIPFYNKALIHYPYATSNAYLACFNYLFRIGWYIFFATYFVYAVSFEFLKGSTPGKMLNNCWIITSGLRRPNFLQITLKNILRLFPINEFTCYFNSVSVNELISGTRTVELDNKTTNLYEELVQAKK